MRFQVPQFIEVESKIVGPLTLKQFLYLAGGGVISVVFYFTTKFIVWIIVTLIVGIISIALAFLKINGQPFSRILLSVINFYLKPKIYVWQPENPSLPKIKENVKKSISNELVSYLEKIITGMSLKNVEEKVRVGASPNAQKAKHSFETTKEKYQIFKKVTGAKEIARRVDYR